ncbi:arginine--tRNA ligase [Chloroflexi bacterium TSY]|nr:arginine--tRNA ligase [Chloroflexi bacterium TSY]
MMLQDKIRQLVAKAITAAQESNSLPSFDAPQIEIMRPNQAEHGDYSTNIALITASAIKKATGAKTNPRLIAQAIVDNLAVDELIGKVELAGPGFINLYLAESWLQKQVAVILQKRETFGNIDLGKGARWQVEYVSANPTGPIHYGGARNAVIGDSLANVLEAAGYDVQREYYVNDGGTQFRLFAETLYARYVQLVNHDEKALQEDVANVGTEEDVEWWRQEGVIPDDGYAGAYMIEYAQKVLNEHGEHFMEMPKAEAIGELMSIGLKIVLDDLAKELAGIGVRFDRWYSEQSLHDEGLVEQVLDELETQGDIIQRDGAVWFAASNFPKNDKDEVVIRNNGSPTYFASDIAYHYDKFYRRKFDRVINVWAVDHQGHVPRMGAVMQALKVDPERLTILMYDLVKLVRDGQEVKLSKRAGNLVTINDVVDEVGADPLRFNLLMRSPESTIEFDLELAVTQTNENPVYFVQYSHARICSILEKAASSGFSDDAETDSKTNIESGASCLLLTHPAELTLIRKMLELEEQILTAIERLSPHNLTYYAIDLAKTFNAFYRDCRVVDPENRELSRARLLLSQAVRVVLARVLGLIGVSAPESM